MVMHVILNCRCADACTSESYVRIAESGSTQAGSHTAASLAITTLPLREGCAGSLAEVSLAYLAIGITADAEPTHTTGDIEKGTTHVRSPHSGVRGRYRGPVSSRQQDSRCRLQDR